MAIQQMLLGIPSASGGGSTTLDGLGSVDFSSGYLNIAADAAMTIGVEDFTIEFWVNPDNFTNRGTFYDSRGASSTTGITIGHEASSGEVRVYMNAGHGADYPVWSSALTTGQWQHIAVTRDSGTIRLFVGGVLRDTGNRTSDMNGNHAVNIGYKTYTGSGYSYFDGKISNLRVVRGQAIYTASFTPSTNPLTTTSQGCQPYDVVFLGCNNPNDATIATVAANLTATNASEDSASPFSSSTVDLSHTGGSVYICNMANNRAHVEFDTEPLTVELSGGEMDFGSGAYTIEYFFKADWISTTRSYSMIAARWDPTNRSFYSGIRDPDDMSYYYTLGSGLNNSRFDGGWVHNKWYHVAICRDSNDTRIYLDGVVKGNFSDTGHDTGNSSANFTIGWQHDGGETFTNGTISNLRIVKGQALYTSNFTPPTEDLTTTSQGATESNVVFLGCQSKYDPRHTVKNAGQRPKVKAELVPAASGEASMTGVQAIGSFDSPFATPVNNGTTWSNYLTCATSSFDISVTKAFDGYRGTAQTGEAARTSANAPLCVWTGFSGITVNKTVHVQHCTSYEHWVEITVDGNTYSTTTMNGLHTFEVSGSLTQIKYYNSNPNGRSYLEAVFIDGQLLVDGLNP